MLGKGNKFVLGNGITSASYLNKVGGKVEIFNFGSWDATLRKVCMKPNGSKCSFGENERKNGYVLQPSEHGETRYCVQKGNPARNQKHLVTN